MNRAAQCGPTGRREVEDEVAQARNGDVRGRRSAARGGAEARQSARLEVGGSGSSGGVVGRPAGGGERSEIHAQRAAD
jgi:hypothetical protein